MMDAPRRVITGLDAEGRSCLLFDEPSSMVIWSTDAAPADCSSMADAGGGKFHFPTSGSVFCYNDFPAGGSSPMHATDTIDYVIIMSGEVVFITETGETLLRAGDILVDRGAVHSWRNDGDVPCRIINVLLPADPVGKGATVFGEIG
jgi:mannose-6-phosphate isomerase-like protein (cupin superfamily)